MKQVFIILAAVLITASVFAQTPEKISYQAIIRDVNDSLITNTQVGMQISILQTSITGNSVYTETQTPTTNNNGVISIEIGSGTLVSGSFADIDWGSDSYFIKTETDINGGSSYTITGTSQLLSVPYALHAKTAESITGGSVNGGKTYLVLSGDITNTEAADYIQNNLGVNTQFIEILNTTQLTSVDFTGLNISELIDLEIAYNQVLSTVTLPDLSVVNRFVRINGNEAFSSFSLPQLTTCISFSCTNSASLTTLSLPQLPKSGDFTCYNNAALTTLSLPVLTSVNNFSCYENAALTTLSLPQFTTCSADFSCSNNISLTDLSLPVLSTANNFYCNENATLTTLSLPQLTTCNDYFSCSNNISLTSLSLPVLSSVNYFYVNSNALNSTAINSFLALFVSWTNFPNNIHMHDQTPAAPPTGQGIIDKQTLIDAGVTVMTD